MKFLNWLSTDIWKRRKWFEFLTVINHIYLCEKDWQEVLKESYFYLGQYTTIIASGAK